MDDPACVGLDVGGVEVEACVEVREGRIDSAFC